MATILVVRAEPVRLKLEASCLDRASLRVRMAGSAQDALALAVSERPALVVVGADMPDAAPEALCRDIRALAGLEDCRLLLVTEQPTADAIPPFLQAGGSGFVLSSASINSLADAVARLLALPVRHLDRVPLQVLAKAEELSRDGAPVRSMFATTLDLSLRGLSLESQHVLAVGMVLRVHFVLPNVSRRVALTGVVRRVVDASRLLYALEFRDLPEDQSQLLRGYLESRTMP